MHQSLVLIPAYEGVTLAQAQKVLDQGQALGEEYLRRMRGNKLYGDVSFLFEISGRVYLASYYLSEALIDHNRKPSINTEADQKLHAFIQLASKHFDVRQQQVIPPANSFWIDAQIKGRLG